MLWRLMLLFTLTPLAELAILVYVGTVIGLLYTLLIVVATGMAGAILARYQGLATLSKIRSDAQQGVMPSTELFEAAMILGGGLLLLTPGIITDIVGLAVLVPQSRRVIGRWLRAWAGRRIEKGDIHFWQVR